MLLRCAPLACVLRRALTATHTHTHSATMAAKKPPAMSVEIPGEEKDPSEEYRRNDPNMEEFERSKRVADALQEMMTPTAADSVLKKQTSMNTVRFDSPLALSARVVLNVLRCFLGQNDVETYYNERLEKAKGLNNPALNDVSSQAILPCLRVTGPF